jgi:serine/threonine protein kinase/WD40 repeat protein
MGLCAGMCLGPYEVLAPLGAGGMGEVYRARDTRLGRQVAVKILPDSLSQDPRRVARFETEARALAALSHPNILGIHDFGQSDGRIYAVTELLDGESLRDRMAGEPMVWRKAAEIAAAIADALASAHAAGIVHRDLKPENVFITSDGRVKVLDFGLAKVVEPVSRDAITVTSPSGGALSVDGEVVGTLSYMAPEQLRGLKVDGRADIFSLGSVLYEMLSGKRPFTGATPADTLSAILHSEPPSLEGLVREIPSVLRLIVSRCLEKRPEDRFDTAHDVALSLRSISTDQPPAARSAESPRPVRRRWLAPAVAAAALALILGVVHSIGVVRRGSASAPSLSLALSFPVDASPDTLLGNPLALTPDGKTLVYSGSKLFVRYLDRDEIRVIPGTEDARYPFVSPDGRSVGFFADRKLKTVSLAGGAPTILCDAAEARGGSWGPNETIVFSPSSMSGLQRISATGEDPRVITTPDPATYESHRFPQILPDGDHVLFQIWEHTGRNQVAVVSLRSGERRVLLEDAAYPRYLPTGHLVFTRPGALFAVGFDPRTLRVSGPPVRVLDDLVTNHFGARYADLSVSEGGTLVYVPARQLRRTLVWVDRKGAAESLAFPPEGYREVALAPDGVRVAAISISKGEETALLVGDVTRGTLSRSSAEGLFQGLAWSPDGKRIAFGFEPKERRLPWQAFWQDADGSAPPERLTSEAVLQEEEPSSFSPDGRLLLLGVFPFGSADLAGTGWNIDVLPLEGGRLPRPFVRTRSDELVGRFSPDGRWVAYQSNDSGTWQVFVRPYPGPGARWQISNEGGTEPRWSRSGRGIFYRHANRLMVVDVTTAPTFVAGRPRPLFELIPFDATYSYDVAPGDQRFLMIRRDPDEFGPVHVNVVLNWFTELRKRVPGSP